ncbi:Signal-induced proliferation-associated 1 like protein 2, partial [Rhizopus azygosporus]
TANNEKSSRKSNRSSVQSISTITEDTTLGIITIVQEKADKGNMSQYRIIIRSKHASITCISEQARYIVHESTAKDTQNQLELKGESKAMDQINSNKRLLPSFKSSNETSESTRLMRAAILSVCPHLDLRSFKELSAESTILSGLEKELIKYDELQIPKHYKFGVLTIKNGQITEESWFSNTGLSKDLQDFLSIMGHKIQLKGYKGYAAGLDTKTGESGEFAYVSKWRDYDITFHVAAIMPSQANDKQQVLRKKHIGNEGNQTFNPKAIRSQFLHVYIVVRPETVHQKRHWRVEVIKHKNVNQFGPPIPSPPLFDDKELKSFLTLKLINAENAALKSDRFFIPNNKARLGLLGNYIQMGLAFNPAETARQSTEKTRPKSANHNHKSRLLHEAHHMEERRRQKLMTTSSVNIPPLIPSISSSSRSTLLTDIKKGFSRKKNEEQMSRKTSKLNITSTPEEDLLIGQDIQVSSESFISPEQLFASSIYEEEIVEQKD